MFLSVTPKTFGRVRSAIFLLLITTGIVTSGHAGEAKGYLGLTGQWFVQDAQHADQKDRNLALTGRAEYFHDFDDNRQRVVASVYGRLDAADTERNHVDLQELYWWKAFDSFELYAGVRKVTWGVTESVHLVDIINQTNTLENIDGEDKLGQPMLEAVLWRHWGTLEAYVLPGFREREYRGEPSRLRPRLPVADEAAYQSDREDRHVDYALRWSFYRGVFDVGVSHFSGTSREPVFLPEQLEGELVLRPHYQQIDQTGLAAQATVGAWLWKLELASVRERDYGRNTAAVAGFEYTRYSIMQTGGDLGLIAEYQFDDRRGARQRFTQNDLALGARWALNDLDNSELLLLVSHDFDNDNQFVSLEASRRLNDDWTVDLEARAFRNVSPGTVEYDLRDDDYVQLEIRRYF